MKSYGTFDLTVESPARIFTEPLSLAQVKAFLELPVRSPADSAEDATLESMIAGARVEAERMQRRDLVMKSWDLRRDHFAPYYWTDLHRRHCLSAEIGLRTPLVSVDLVQYTDSNGTVTPMTEGVDYIVDLHRGIILPPYNRTWPSFTPWPSSAVLIRHTAGLASDDPFWSNAGQPILMGMKQLISAWFTHRIPFEIGPGTANEYPYMVTALLSAGGRKVVK